MNLEARRPGGDDFVDPRSEAREEVDRGKEPPLPSLGGTSRRAVSSTYGEKGGLLVELALGSTPTVNLRNRT